MRNFGGNISNPKFTNNILRPTHSSLSKNRAAYPPDLHKKASFDKYARKPADSRRDPLSKYQRISKSKAEIGPASRDQFRHYLSDCTNVFYQNSPNARKLDFIYTLRPLLNSILGVLLLLWGILFFINKYEGHCPHNAECGVYIHCHPGFQLEDGLCKISREIIDNAESIGLAAVNSLEYEYGDSECGVLTGQEGASLVTPKRTVEQILNEFQTEAMEPLINQLYAWLRELKNQRKYNFSYHAGVVVPVKKKYSLNCRLLLITREQYFPHCLAIGVVLVVLIVWLIFHLRFIRQANEIYNYLETQIKAKKDMAINIEELSRLFGFISDDLWQRVDRIRSSRQNIVYYEDQSYIHWKLL